MSTGSAPQLLRLHLRGQVFDIPRNCFHVAPESRLSKMAADTEWENGEDGVMDIFLDRSPLLFRPIHDFYLDGNLHFPPSTCKKAFTDELNFWDIKEDMMSPCCYDILLEAKDRANRLVIFQELLKCHDWSEERARLLLEKCTPLRKRLAEIAIFFEHPDSSAAAKIWSMFFGLVILLSLLVLAIDTVVDWRSVDDLATQACMNTTLYQFRLVAFILSTKPCRAILILESVTLSLITVELLVRLLFSLDRRMVYLCPCTAATLLSLLPSWIVVVTEFAREEIINSIMCGFIYCYMPCYFLRTLRLMYLLRQLLRWQSLCVIGTSLRASWRELVLLVLLLFMGSCIFGTTIFIAESDQDNIQNIPHGFWWALVTMTTVGYGDVYPLTVTGRLVGCLCSISGILIVALPIPVIANNFNTYYSIGKVVGRLGKREEGTTQCKKSLNKFINEVSPISSATDITDCAKSM